MKLKNKIISLATPLAIASAIVPLTTLISCNDSESIKMHDLLQFTPKFEKSSTESIDLARDATTEYISWLITHASSFADDLAYGTRKNWQESLPKHSEEEDQAYWAELHSLDFGCTRPKFGWANVQYPGEEDQDYPTVSIKTKLHADFSLYIYNQQTQQSKVYTSGFVIDYSIDVSSHLSNMLFFVKQHGLSTTDYIVKVKQPNPDIKPLNVWNVTTFDRGNNSAYKYRTDQWHMDINSKCNRKITYYENYYPTAVDQRTNSFKAYIDNAALYNQVQRILLSGNNLFDQIMKLTPSDDPYVMENLVEELTGYRGTASDQFDILLYTASAATMDFASYYLSDAQAKYAINTYQPLECTRDVTGVTRGESVGPGFKFYTYGDETEPYLDYTPWVLERTLARKESKSSNADPREIAKIELVEPLTGTSLTSGKTIQISAPTDDNILYQKPESGKEPVAVPLMFVGTVSDASGDSPYTYDEIQKLGQDTFYLNNKKLRLNITYTGETTPNEVEETIDQPIVRIYFKTK